MRSGVRIGFWPLALTIALVTGVQGRAQAGPTTPTIAVSLDPLTPYTSGGCYNPRRYPCYQVFGTADAGATIVITATSGASPGLSVTETTFAAAADDRGAGIQAGDWAASPNVTDLGLHGTEPSKLTFTVVAQDASGAASAPATATVSKVAVTSGDPQGPKVTPAKVLSKAWPPQHWSATGLPSFNFCLFTPQGCSGEASISGSVEDDSDGALGLASEVADVIITITRTSDNVLVQELHPFVRRGTQAFYGAAIRHRDFQIGQTYRVSVRALDAWGQAGNTASSTFTVLP